MSLDQLEAEAKAASAEWTRQQTTGRRNSPAYKAAYLAKLVASRAWLAAKLALDNDPPDLRQ